MVSMKCREHNVSSSCPCTTTTACRGTMERTLNLIDCCNMRGTMLLRVEYHGYKNNCVRRCIKLLTYLHMACEMLTLMILFVDSWSLAFNLRSLPTEGRRSDGLREWVLELFQEAPKRIYGS